MTGCRWQLFDTASLYFRAFYGLPSSLTTRDGRPVNAVRGLLDFIATFVAGYQPDFIACAWDASWRPAWRVARVPSYKAHRVALGEEELVPPELAVQVPLIVEVLNALGLVIVGADDYEADDVLATLADRRRGPTDIVTGDRDLFQLVDDAAEIRVLYVGRGVSKHERVTDAWLTERYGINGRQYVDFATLRGDASDGLPGVKGVGEKTAAALLRRYGDLAGILTHLPELTPTQARTFSSHADYLRAAVPVVACARDLTLPELDFTRPRSPRDPDRFTALAAELNLGRSADRILAALAG